MDGTGEKSQGQIRQSFVGQAREENHLNQREKQPNNRVCNDDVQAIKRRRLPRFGRRFNDRSNLL